MRIPRFGHTLLCTLMLSALGHTILGTSAQTTDTVDNSLSVLDRWLEHRSRAKTLKAEFLHITRLATFKKEIRRQGILWAAGTDLLKCELRNDKGQLLTTILRNKNGFYIIDEDSKEYELTSDTEEAPTSFQVLSALTGNADLRRQFSIVSWSKSGTNIVYQMRPLNPTAQHRIREAALTLADADVPLFRAFSLRFADGSQVRTEALKATINLQIDTRLFYPDLTGLKRISPTVDIGL